jgi:hypothetical protein
MTDIDTSRNVFDPHPSLTDLIERFEAAERGRPLDAPVRIVRVAMLQTIAWRQDVRLAGPEREVTFERAGRTVQFNAYSREGRLREALAQTGEHLGLERVGRVVETIEGLP